jgi:hypothetical protein
LRSWRRQRAPTGRVVRGWVRPIAQALTAPCIERSQLSWPLPWIADLDRLAALNPKIAVAGHKKVGTPDAPAAIEESKRYLTDFGRLKQSTAGERGLYDAMTELYPDWASNQTWLMFGLG